MSTLIARLLRRFVQPRRGMTMRSVVTNHNLERAYPWRCDLPLRLFGMSNGIHD
jgi:hypothetical protein